MDETQQAQESTLVPVTTLFEALADETVAIDGSFNHIVIRQMETGEVAYRLFPRGGGDYEGGVLHLGT